MPDRATPRAFDIAYEGTPTWETGRPQPAVLQLLQEGVIGPRVLDSGCGSGLHSVLMAEWEHTVTGVDIAAAAVVRARARARTAGVEATFIHGDVLDLPVIAGARLASVDTVLDVGLFHVLQPADRGAYAAATARVTRAGGNAFVVAWSDRNPFGRGPARVSRCELRDAFRAATGWTVEAIEPSTLESRLAPGRVHAWLARLRRVELA